MKKTIALILAMLMLVLVCAGCSAENAASSVSESSQEESDLQYVLNKGEMVIGYTDYAPMNYFDENGDFTGFDTEFAEAVCEKLGVKAKFVEIVWETKTVEIAAKSMDAIWNGMTITDELKDAIDISDAYAKNAQVIVIKKDNAALYTDTASLADAKLSFEQGSAAEDVIKNDENLSNAEQIPVTKQTDALLEVKSGASDAAILDITLANSMVGEGTDYADLMLVENVELSKEEYGIGFRKNSDLCTKVNEIMAELKADGTLQALADKYGLTLAD